MVSNVVNSVYNIRRKKKKRKFSHLIMAAISYRVFILAAFTFVNVTEFSDCQNESLSKSTPNNIQSATVQPNNNLKEDDDYDEDSIHFPKKSQQQPIRRKNEIMCDQYVKLACELNKPKVTTTPSSNEEGPKRHFIVGGKVTMLNEHPHMALIGYGEKSDERWLCGGSLINERFVLSAAHCAMSSSGPARWARLGESDLNMKTNNSIDFEIIDRIIHPNYKNTSVYYDIALFKLDRNVTFTLSIRPICLYPKENIQPGNFLIATGWGQMGLGELSSDSLLKVTVDETPIDSCVQAYGTDVKYDRGIDTKSMICAGSDTGGRDTCVGDSGGPLVIRINNCTFTYYQVGITSFGRSCGLADSPGIYTKVSFYLQWIESIVWK